jgi:formate hydrogenlyase subunit 6/NADH:ubiquinone oxidoreductase subunit I
MHSLLRAISLLALHLWKHVFLKVTRLYRAGGAKRFIENYQPERIHPIPPRVREALPARHRCIGCGLCDGANPKPEVSVMTLVGCGLRDFLRYARTSVLRRARCWHRAGRRRWTPSARSECR